MADKDKSYSEKNLDELFSRFEKRESSHKKRYPFKFLDSYQKEDRDIFFGRDEEIEELYRKFYSSNLLLVYGRSGTGKTSLIDCGLRSKIPPEDIHFISIRCADKPTQNLFATLNKEAKSHSADAAILLNKIYDSFHKPLCLIFDQFEEVFILAPQSEREELAKTLSSIIKDTSNTKIIIVLREEYLAHLSEFEEMIPTLFSNRIRIERMRQQKAIKAIEGPCKTVGITIDEGVPEAILEKIKEKTEIELSYLQVYLDKLYRTAAEENETTIRFTKEHIGQIGEIGDVLQAFLEEQITNSSDPDKLRTLLKTLISPQGTKKTVLVDEIPQSVKSLGYELTPSKIKTFIQYLVKKRIVRELEEGQLIELRHDTLAIKVFEWLTQQEKDFIEAQNSIAQRLQDYKKQGLLLDEGFIKSIAPYQAKLITNPDFRDLINKSKEALEAKRKRRKRIIISSVSSFIALCLIFIFFLLSGLNREKQLINDQEWELYRMNLGFADKYIEDNSLIEARKLLSSCPEKFRDWEWGRLHFLCNQDLMTIKLPKGMKYLDYLTFNPSDNTLIGIVSASYSVESYEKSICKWAISTGEKLSEHKLGNADFRKIIINSAGKMTALGIFDFRKVILWDVDNSEEILSFNTNYLPSPIGLPYVRPDISKDSKYIAARNGMRIIIWDVNRNSLHYSFECIDCSRICFSNNSKIFSWGNNQGKVVLFDLFSKKVITNLNGHSNRITDIDFFSDDSGLISCDNNFKSIIWDLNSFKAVKLIEDFGREVVLSTNDSYLVSTTYFYDFSTLWNISTLSPKKRGDFPGNREVAFSPDNNLLCIADSFYPNETHSISIHNINKNSKRTVLEGHEGPILDIDFSPDGSMIATAGQDSTVRIWDSLSGKSLLVLTGHSGWVYSVDFSPDNRYLISAGQDATVKIWDLIEKKCIYIFDNHEEIIHSAVFYPNGQYVASASWDGTVKIWDWNSNEIIKIIYGKNFLNEAEDPGFECIDVSPDGRMLATATGSGDLRLWDTSTWKTIIKLTSARRKMTTKTDILFNKDGSLVAGRDGDHVFRIWDVDSGKILYESEGVWAYAFNQNARRIFYSRSFYDVTQIKEFIEDKEIFNITGYPYGTRCIAISPDDLKVVTGGDDGKVILWNAFPWETEKLPANDAIKIEERIELFKRDFWKKYMRKSLREVKSQHVDSPLSSSSRIDQGLFYLVDGKLIEAEEEMKQALKINPDSLRASLVIGWIYYLKDEVENSTYFYNKVKSADIDYYNDWHKNTLNDLGWAIYLNGYIDLALKHFLKAVEFNKNDFAAQYNIALVYLAKNELENSYKQYVYVTEDLKAGENTIGYAIEDIDSLIAKNPDNIFSYLIRGYLYQYIGNLEMGAQDLSFFIENFAGDEKWINLAHEWINK